MPSEDEWLFAAHYGEPEGQKFLFSGSNDIYEIAWHYQNACDVTQLNMENFGIHLTGQLKPNFVGIYDMTGNVSELCFDRSGPRCISILIKGGGWEDNYETSKLTNRLSYSKNKTYTGLGFRLIFNYGSNNQ